MLKTCLGIIAAVSLFLTGQPLPIEHPTAISVPNESHIVDQSAAAAYPPAVQDALKKVRKAGGHVIVHVGDKTYVVVGAGQRPTGGYRLTLDQVKQTAGNSYEVRVREHKPAPGAMKTQVISFPTLVVALPHSHANVQVKLQK